MDQMSGFRSRIQESIQGSDSDESDSGVGFRSRIQMNGSDEWIQESDSGIDSGIGFR